MCIASALVAPCRVIAADPAEVFRRGRPAVNRLVHGWAGVGASSIAKASFVADRKIE